MNRFVLFCTALLLSLQVSAQSGPNCRPVNASLDANGDTYLLLSDFVTTAALPVGCEVTITNSFGGPVFGPTQVDPGDPIIFNACSYLSQTLKINVSNQFGACWSYLTFKQSNGPVLMGRSKDVYCFDSLVIGGHIDDEPPLAFVPCVAEFDAEFVADWVQVYECADPFAAVNDTLKVIYREYEAFDKAGNRGFTFDTITVFRLPWIDVVEVPNAYCAEKDTIYCGQGNPGPYMVYPERCDPAMFGMDQDGDGVACDTFYFLLYDDSLERYVLNPALNDTKCGVLTHLDYWSFESNGCEENSKYILEIKQTCVPPPSGICAIDAGLIPTNAFVEIVSGYYQCEFWVVELDTVGPTLTCMSPELFVGPLASENWDHLNIIPETTTIDSSGVPRKLRYNVSNPQDGVTFGLVSSEITVDEDTELEFSWDFVSPDESFDDLIDGIAFFGVFGYELNGEFHNLLPSTDIDFGALTAADQAAFTAGMSVLEPIAESMDMPELLGDHNPDVSFISSNTTFWGGVKIKLYTGDDFAFVLFAIASGDVSAIIGRKNVVPTSSHECAAHTYIPPVKVSDDWSGVKQVKASIEGVGNYTMTLNSETGYWESHQQIKLPKKEDP
ncbi:MAG: hypothetical protein OEM26_05180, partial [Saprospiraceae bacterium]|nr:hypothetical protein [Saprospiraceae bacterium]